jgi:hypothetical protein
MTIPKEVLAQAKLFSLAIRREPNDVKATAKHLLEVAGIDQAQIILQTMEDPNSELSILLASIGNAFHAGSGGIVPAEVEPIDIPCMARKIQQYIK